MGAEERVWWGMRGVLELVDGMVLEIWGLRGTVGVLFERGEVDTGAGGAFFFFFCPSGESVAEGEMWNRRLLQRIWYETRENHHLDVFYRRGLFSVKRELMRGEEDFSPL